MRTEPVVRCRTPGCEAPADFTIAAVGRDEPHQGRRTDEFARTFRRLPRFRDAETPGNEYEPVRDETIEEPGAFRLEPSEGDRNLERDHALESTLRRRKRPGEDRAARILNAPGAIEA